MESVELIYRLWNGVDAEVLRNDEAEWFEALVQIAACMT